jgi:energy-coupling factor transporter transmembrane protein EcfT
MRNTLKFLLYAALILFVGLPIGFVLFVAAMALFGVVVGVGFGILGMIMTALKFALMIVLPIVLLIWVAKRFLAPERTY